MSTEVNTNRLKDGRRLPTTARWMWVLWIVVIFFMVNSLLAWRSTQSLVNNTQSIETALQIITLIKELRMQLYAAESGQRGYLITQDPQYLDPFHDAQGRIEQLMLELTSKSLQTIRQQNRLLEIERLMNEKLGVMRRSIDYVVDEQVPRAVRLENSDRGIVLTRKLNELIDGVEEVEHGRLWQVRDESDNRAKFMLLTLWATNGLGVGLLLVIYLVYMRYASNTNRLYAEIENANAVLENRVRERTEELKQYSDELERSNRELQDFAFVASHDLQEPLRKIRAFGDRLLSKYGEVLGEQGEDYTRRMHAASERMSTLIDDLLSFSRVTTQQKPFEQVDLNKLLESVADNFDYGVEQTGAKILIDPLPCVQADASQLHQVFSNLIGNSLKFAHPDRLPIIRIRCEQEESVDAPSDPKVTIIVADNGIGFDEQYKDRIFNLFQRLHSREEYQGTGIGLALCRKIIERHRGTIEARSIPGEGTEFVMQLPLNQIQTAPNEESRNEYV